MLAADRHIPPRFIADAMLGGLARWLRVLGYDTRFQSDWDDHHLVAEAQREGRILLTRDRHLITHLRPQHGHLLAAQKPLAQLEEVIVACRPPLPRQLFTRCLRCNTLLEAATVAQAKAVPAGSRHLGPVLRCPDCERLYWPGSHTWRMREKLAHTLRHWPQSGAS